MYGSFPPNSTKLAKFWRHLATIIKEREAIGGAGSIKKKVFLCFYQEFVKIKKNYTTKNVPDIRLNCLGLSMAGHKSLKNIKPLTTLVLTNLSWGHLPITDFWRQPHIYLKVLKWKIKMKCNLATFRNIQQRGYLAVANEAFLIWARSERKSCN